MSADELGELEDDDDSWWTEGMVDLPPICDRHGVAFCALCEPGAPVP